MENPLRLQVGRFTFFTSSILTLQKGKEMRDKAVTRLVQSPSLPTGSAPSNDLELAELRGGVSFTVHLPVNRLSSTSRGPGWFSCIERSLDDRHDIQQALAMGLTSILLKIPDQPPLLFLKAFWQTTDRLRWVNHNVKFNLSDG